MPNAAIMAGARQCKRIKRNGERCGNPALKGLEVCRFHGANKAAIAKGRQRWELEQQEARTLQLVQKYAAEVDPNLSVVDQYQIALANAVAWNTVCQQQLEALTDTLHINQSGDAKLDARIALYERSLDRVEKFLNNAQHLKLDETRVQIEAIKLRKLADVWNGWVQDLFGVLRKRLPGERETLDLVAREDVPRLAREHLTAPPA